MTTGTILAFLGIATLAYVTPGPDWFVVMRHASTSRRAGLIAALGVQCGLLVHMTAAAVGVAALLLTSAEAFTALKLVGAAYLVYLGIRSLHDSFGQRGESAATTATVAPGRVWRQSFTANVLNPKAALFFVAVLPQFVSSGTPVAPQIVALGLLDIALGAVWWVAFVVGVRAFQTLLGGRRSRIVIDRVAGTALISLGGVLALSGRRAV